MQINCRRLSDFVSRPPLEEVARLLICAIVAGANVVCLGTNDVGNTMGPVLFNPAHLMAGYSYACVANDSEGHRISHDSVRQHWPLIGSWSSV